MVARDRDGISRKASMNDYHMLDEMLLHRKLPMVSPSVCETMLEMCADHCLAHACMLSGNLVAYHGSLTVAKWYACELV